MNLHPGIQTLFRVMNGDELTIAELIREGELQSPQRYKNVSLFNIRITGTGVSYRPVLKEWVYRRPEDYLTERFVKRCNGLPVIWQHPEKSLLTSDEFEDRVVGTVFLPYIEGDEVWAVVKIYDNEAIQLLESEQLSTSPAVLVGPESKSYELKDGSILLVEDRASLLDHIAICSVGVWDKGEGPSGVEANLPQGELAMADEAKKEEEKKEDSAKVDASKRMDEGFDMLLKKVDEACEKMDAANKRLDAWEEEEKKKADQARKDAEEAEENEKMTEAERVAADKKRKDAEEEEKEKAKEDAAKADKARVDSLMTRLDEQSKTIEQLTAMVRQPIPDADRASLAAIQARADAVQVQLGAGNRAPAPLVGESTKQYRCRMLGLLQTLSKQWDGVKLDALDDKVLDLAENQIYADAALAARTPSNIKEGGMREIRRQTDSGHWISDFVAGPNTHFVHSFSPRASMRRVRSIRTPQ